MADAETTSSSAPAEAPAPAPAPSSAPAPAPAPSSESSPAASTAVKTGEPKETLLDAVLKVAPATPETDVLASKDTSEAPTSQPDAEAKADATTEETADDDTSDDVPAEASAGVRKKVNKLLRQRRELRDEVAKLTPHAQIGNDLSTFVQRHGISGDDLVRGLNVMAALSQGDYKSFYEMVGPYVRVAQEYLGVVLPNDLQARVDQGHMTPETAYEFAKTRFDGRRAQVEAETVRDQSAHHQVSVIADNVQRAVTDYEGRLEANDPDYKAKAESVRRTAQAILYERGGRIASVREALDITKAAYDEVNKQFRRFQPAPRATAPSPNGSMQQTHTARPAPKTMMEAALQGLENARRTG